MLEKYVLNGSCSIGSVEFVTKFISFLYYIGKMYYQLGTDLPYSIITRGRFSATGKMVSTVLVRRFSECSKEIILELGV